MSDRHYIGMVALAVFAGLVSVFSPQAAISPALFLFVIGFDAIATEARRAETLKDGSVHEGAGLQGIAQTQSSTPDNKDKQDG